jgi:hypothetical protein
MEEQMLHTFLFSIAETAENIPSTSPTTQPNFRDKGPFKRQPEHKRMMRGRHREPYYFKPGDIWFFLP